MPSKRNRERGDNAGAMHRCAMPRHCSDLDSRRTGLHSLGELCIGAGDGFVDEPRVCMSPSGL